MFQTLQIIIWEVDFNYDCANLIVNFFVALGTVGAVAVSLILSVQSRKEKIKIDTSIEWEYLFDGLHKVYWVIIKIVNIGVIDFRLNDYHVYINDEKILDDEMKPCISFPLNKTPIPAGGVINITMPADAFDSHIDSHPKQNLTVEQSVEIIKQGKITITTSRGKKLSTSFSEGFVEGYRIYRREEDQIKPLKNNA